MSRLVHLSIGVVLALLLGGTATAAPHPMDPLTTAPSRRRWRFHDPRVSSA
jgi:hypothetical protein